MNWNFQIQQEFQYQTLLYQGYPYCFSYPYPNVSQFQFLNPQILSNNSQKQKTDQSSKENEEIERGSKLKEKIQIKKSIKSIKSNKKEKKNIRNIIPNLARKILNYISSENSADAIKLHFRTLTSNQIEQYYEFINFRKSSLGIYIGNKDLKQIWYGKEEYNAKYFAISRFLSKKFLNDYCVSSILLSKKMKPSLKKQHLRYRRKIMKILNKHE